MTKGSVYQEDIRVLNIYTSKSFKYTKGKLIELQGEIDKSTIIAGSFQYLFFNNFQNKQAESQEDIEDLSNASNQLDPTGVYRITKAEYASFFKCAWNIFLYR